MIQNIYIFGTGGFAKEVFFLIQEINKVELLYEVKGFIDINPSFHNLKISDKTIDVLSEKDFFGESKQEDNYFAIGIGNPKIINIVKEKYSTILKFPNLIHPNFVSQFDTIKMGIGNIITAGCIFTIDIEIGSFNIFNLNTTVGHDTIIGNCNVFNPGVNVSGGVNIGSNNLLGTNSTILQLISIDDNNTLGALSLANKNFGSNNVMVGVPAKKIER